MAHFAKLFNIDNEIQVVVSIDADKEGLLRNLHEKSILKKIQVQLIHEFDTEENCMDALVKYDLARAKAFVVQMMIAITDVTGEGRVNGTSFTKN